MGQNTKLGEKICFARELYDAFGILYNHFREINESFNEIVDMICRFVEINIFGVVRENNKVMANFSDNIFGLKYGFTIFSGGNQVEALPPAFSVGHNLFDS